MKPTTPSPLQTGQPPNRCWSRIGVWGDGTCSELAKYVHCCNCPVYSQAGRTLLEGPAPEGYAREWEECLLESDPHSNHKTTPVLVFRLGPEWLGLPAARIAYVTEKRPVHRLPHRSDRVLTGLVNISGTLHPAFNLRELLELPDEAPEGITLSRRVYPRMLLFRREQQAFAFGADEVFGIAPLDQDQLQPVPATVSKALATFTRGLFPFNECSVGLLDDELLEHSLTRQHLNL
jgi:chemotaxis-related protein WspD